MLSRNINSSIRLDSSRKIYKFCRCLIKSYYNNCIIKDVEQIHDFEFFVDHIEKSILNESDMNEIKNAIDIWGKSEFIKSKSESNAKKKTTRGKK